MSKYILGIDQSTQGTKAILFGQDGELIARADVPHRQIVNDLGWVEHDPEEIYVNTIQAVIDVVKKSGIDKSEIASVGISNQRETSLVWDKSGTPLYNAIVWQDSRAEDICEEVRNYGSEQLIEDKTGIKLSPYFPAAKLAWILRHVPSAASAASNRTARMGTVDTWLVYKLTGGSVYKTDYSNASRTQLFDLDSLTWNEEICSIFGIDNSLLAEVSDSDGDFGETDFDGFLDKPIHIHSVMGDSHAALFGQGCTEAGMVKATYGTGSSVMMNAGSEPVRSTSGLVTSLAWKLGGKVNYVLEGNINYAGAVITWLKDDLGLISSAQETGELAEQASKEDTTILVPAFSGLGAPYWSSGATAMFCGMTRTTKKAELVKAALDSIAYQIADIIKAMETDLGSELDSLRTDGGPTSNGYLMQMQCEIIRIPVLVSHTQELSAMGAAYAAGIAEGIYDVNRLFSSSKRREYTPAMDEETADRKYKYWKTAVEHALNYQTER